MIIFNVDTVPDQGKHLNITVGTIFVVIVDCNVLTIINNIASLQGLRTLLLRNRTKINISQSHLLHSPSNTSTVHLGTITIAHNQRGKKTPSICPSFAHYSFSHFHAVGEHRYSADSAFLFMLHPVRRLRCVSRRRRCCTNHCIRGHVQVDVNFSVLFTQITHSEETTHCLPHMLQAMGKSIERN